MNGTIILQDNEVWHYSNDTYPADSLRPNYAWGGPEIYTLCSRNDKVDAIFEADDGMYYPMEDPEVEYLQDTYKVFHKLAYWVDGTVYTISQDLYSLYHFIDSNRLLFRSEKTFVAGACFREAVFSSWFPIDFNKYCYAFVLPQRNYYNKYGWSYAVRYLDGWNENKGLDNGYNNFIMFTWRPCLEFVDNSSSINIFF